MLASKAYKSAYKQRIYGNALLRHWWELFYLDYGYKKCKRFVEQRLIKTFIDLNQLAQGEVNFKSKIIIEWGQKNRLDVQFVLVGDQLSKENKRLFCTELTISGKPICQASGSCKKESQQKAAAKLTSLFNRIRYLYRNCFLGAWFHPSAEQNNIVGCYSVVYVLLLLVIAHFVFNCVIFSDIFYIFVFTH